MRIEKTAKPTIIPIYSARKLIIKPNNETNKNEIKSTF